MPTVSTSPIDTDGVVRCFAHGLEASFKTSHRHTNPGRKFYCCQKTISDPERCKFFYWADQIEELRQMNPTPRKRSSESASGPQPETPSQKRLRLIQESLGQLPNDEASSSHTSLMTPPSTNDRPGRSFFREESPTPLPRSERASASHNFLSTVDYSVSQELRSLTESLQTLQPNVEKLERLRSADDKTISIKSDRIKQLEEENKTLKQTVADREEEIKGLRKALLDTRST